MLPGQWIPGQCRHRLDGNGLDTLVHPPRELLREVADERRDVVLALAQRRIHDRKHVEAVIQIAAKLFVRHHGDEVAVGRGHEPDVDADRPGAAKAFELLLLQHPQQLRLQLQGDVTDLVQKQRPAMRQLESADAAARWRR